MFDAADPNSQNSKSIVAEVQSSDLIARIKGKRTILKNFITIYFVTKPEMSAVSCRQPCRWVFLDRGLGLGRETTVISSFFSTWL